ncbi:NPL4 family-domain-containing protein [Jimgerdemannia flammicorona]|uniref:Nuclear protein localization protein 4 n=1 Tax=Jimgerdemannia flammicorona TaxID=994334 RepID=A0A433QXX4_9FUNG|nr:NPL4 family-domain-containing protein [Jimgerdemannia flammicorona]
MLVRIRSKEGTVRVEVNPTDDVVVLGQKIAAILNIADPVSIMISDQPQVAGARRIFDFGGKSLASIGVQHGDLLFVTIDTSSSEELESTPTLPAVAIEDHTSIISPPMAPVMVDAVDEYLEKQSGLIKRGRDPKFCKHTVNGMCDYCMPMEPYDSRYLEQNKIKHMSFHAYLRQLNAAQKGKDAQAAGSAKAVAPLEEPNYKVKVPCKGRHAPWPEGICTNCQPSAVTLQSQPFRLVDYIEFSAASLIDNFIHYWRSTGCQRFGYLYGRYEPYTEVPLGIKAVVEAIYEPPQQTALDGVALAPQYFGSEEEARIDAVALACGLRRVGCIFTDLIDDGTLRGTVVTKRHVDSYFLSSLECCFAAEMQRRHPNTTSTSYSTSGKFGSKFVTCVLSGNEEGHVDVAGYQVSNTCVAMVDAGIVEPSVKPSVMRVKEAVAGVRYVPEVFYKYKNKYGVNVQESAKPTFPVDYLLVNVSHGFPQTAKPLFTASTPFPIENRIGLDTQDFDALRRYLTVPDFANAVSDFHLLCFVMGMGVLGKLEFETLVRVAMSKDPTEVAKLVELGGWKTLQMVMQESVKAAPQSHLGHTSAVSSPPMSRTGSTASSAAGSAGRAAPELISCRHCTLLNPGTNVNCEICSLPLRD